MTTTEHVAKQTARLSCLVNFPQFDEGRSELVKALESCHSDRHATAVVDRMVESEHYCPTPSNLRAVAAEMGAQFRPAAPKGCGKCTDGWTVTTYLVTWMDGKKTKQIVDPRKLAANVKLEIGKQMLYEAVAFCTCEAGEHRKRLWASREEAEQAEPVKKGRRR
jgi:predicted butyrate kinase (DUF1464 family)